MGCTGPILAGLMVSALAAGDSAAALTAFAVFNFTMACLMLIVSGLVAASRRALIARLKASTRRVKRASGTVVLVVGAFQVYAAIDIGGFVRLLFP